MGGAMALLPLPRQANAVEEPSVSSDLPDTTITHKVSDLKPPIHGYMATWLHGCMELI